jgi:hypothetical protein
VSRLQDLEQGGGRWTFDGNERITPALQLLGPDDEPVPSSLNLEALLDELVTYYEREQENPDLQWNPYSEGQA